MSGRATSRAIKPDAALRWLAALALVVGLAATLKGFFALDGFWEDEFYELAFLNEGFPHFFVQIARLDQHPPFHFLQLKLWSVFFNSDKGLLLNSVVWHVVSCGVVFWVGRAWLGTTAGMLAVAFFSLSPQVVSASVALRMYAMVPALAVGVWWLNIRLLSDRETRWWPWLGLLALQLALGYSHAIAIYFIAFFVVSAGAQVGISREGGLPWRRWFGMQSVVAVLLLPLAVAAVVRVSMPGQSDGGGNSDTGNVIAHFGGMVAGWGLKFAYGKAMGAGFYALAVLLGVWSRPMRVLAVTVLLGPYACAALIALFLAPMFKTPVYSAMLVPFACLTLAGGLVALSTRVRSGLTAVVLVGMVAVVFPFSGQLLDRTSPYKPIAEELKRRVAPGDVVVVPKVYLYWAVMRYAVAPNWGSALEVLPALSDKWQKMMDRLGPDLAHALKLIPKTSHVVHDGVTYVIGEDALKDSQNARRVWLVERLRYPMPTQLAPGFIRRGVVAEYGDRETTRLELFERP